MVDTTYLLVVIVVGAAAVWWLRRRGGAPVSPAGGLAAGREWLRAPEPSDDEVDRMASCLADATTRFGSSYAVPDSAVNTMAAQAGLARRLVGAADGGSGRAGSDGPAPSMWANR